MQSLRGGEWYLKKRGSRKILPGSRNLGSVFDKSRSLVSAWFVFTFFDSRNFLPKSLGLGFLTRISVSRRVSDFTIRHAFSDTQTCTPASFGASAIVESHLPVKNPGYEPVKAAAILSQPPTVFMIIYLLFCQIT